MRYFRHAKLMLFYSHALLFVFLAGHGNMSELCSKLCFGVFVTALSHSVQNLEGRVFQEFSVMQTNPVLQKCCVNLHNLFKRKY